jgi:hypothetical protein
MNERESVEDALSGIREKVDWKRIRLVNHHSSMKRGEDSRPIPCILCSECWVASRWALPPRPIDFDSSMQDDERRGSRPLEIDPVALQQRRHSLVNCGGGGQDARDSAI